MNYKNIVVVMLSLLLGKAYSQSDDCSSASQITPTITTCTLTSGSSMGATQSLAGCSGNADDDVWFYFVANSTEMEVKVDPTAGYDAVFELFAGSCAGPSLGCRDAKGIGLNEKRTYQALTIGNSYYLRIYHQGSGSGSNIFRVCVSGLAPTTNTSPCSAYALPAVTPACNYSTYALTNHTGSSVGTPFNCGGSSPFQGGYSGGDMWFSVVVPSSGNVEVSTLPGDLTDCAMALYSGSSCSSLTQVSCNDDRIPANNKFMPYIYSTGNTPGSTMYIRIWDYNNNSGGKFKICVSTPDNDLCPTALKVCDINGFGGTTSPQYNADRPGNMAGRDENPSGPFGIGYTGSSPVQLDNNSWITFEAAATTASFTVDIEDCLSGISATGGVQMQIFSGNNCDNFAPVSNFLETKTSQLITANGLVVGNTYYIVIDGFAGDVCSYTVSANSGVQVVQVNSSNNNICSGDPVSVTAQVFGSGSFTYTWTSIPAGGPYPSTSTINVSPTVTTEYFVDITGLCGQVTQGSYKVFVDQTPTAPSVVASPSTICPSGSSVITASGTSGATYLVYTSPAAGSAVGSTPFTHTGNGTSGTTTYYVETRTGNGCLSGSRTAVTINANDVQGPSLSCPSNQVVNLDAGCQYTLADFRTSTTVSDNCYTTGISVSQSPLPGALLSGHNTVQNVTITAVDPAGNSSSCTFTVTLQDVTPPVITCMSDRIENVDGSCNYTIPDFAAMLTGSDNCTPSNTIIYSQTPLAGTVISGVGFVQPIRIIATDVGNNKDTCSFTVTLQDVTPAVLSCPADLIDTTRAENCTYTVPDFSAFATLTSNNCVNNGGGTGITQTPAIGTAIDASNGDQPYLVTLTYTDASNNTSVCSFNVTATCVREVIIPQFISPNQDGFNDYFVIQNIGLFYSNNLKVFNRYGDMVFNMDNYDNTWGGKLNATGEASDLLPTGTYFYVLSLDGADDISGFVQLQR